MANHPYANLVAIPTLKGRSNQTKSPAIAHKIILESNKQDDANYNFDAVDLMLQGNLQAQINYSIVKGIAQAINQKTEILQKAQTNYTPLNGVSFAEAAMQEIEAMGQSIVDSYVNFQKSAIGKPAKLPKLYGKNIKIKRVRLLTAYLMPKDWQNPRRAINYL